MSSLRTYVDALRAGHLLSWTEGDCTYYALTGAAKEAVLAKEKPFELWCHNLSFAESWIGQRPDVQWDLMEYSAQTHLFVFDQWFFKRESINSASGLILRLIEEGEMFDLMYMLRGPLIVFDRYHEALKHLPLHRFKKGQEKAYKKMGTIHFRSDGSFKINSAT